MNSTDRENIAQVINFFWDKTRAEPHSIVDDNKLTMMASDFLTKKRMGNNLLDYYILF